MGEQDTAGTPFEKGPTLMSRAFFVFAGSCLFAYRAGSGQGSTAVRYHPAMVLTSPMLSVSPLD